MLVSVVVPVFRNANTLQDLFERVRVTLAEMAGRVLFEVVFVDDGSDDNSLEVLLGLRERFQQTVEVVQLTRNFGQFSAILAGIEASHGDAIIVLSADLQDPPELITDLVDGWLSGSEVVIAHRVGREDSRLSSALSRAAYKVARLQYPDLPEGGFDYLLLSRRAACLFSKMTGRHRFFQGDIYYLGFKVLLVPYVRQRRPDGRGGWTISKRLEYFTDLLLDSTYIPMRFLARVGLVLAAGGLLYAVWIVVARFLGGTPFPGWAPIMVAILLVGGMTLTMQGLMGEYLWRMYDDIKDRPRYIVAQRWGPQDD